MAAEKLLSSKTKAQIEAEAKALQGAVATTNLSERPLNNVMTNPNYAADLARQQARAQENRNLAAAADSLPGSTPEYQAAVGKLFDTRTQSVLSTRPDLQTLAANKGIDMRVPAIADEWRNRQKEQEYIKKLGGSPRTAEEYDLMMKAVYSPSTLQANGWTPTAALPEGAQAMTTGGTGQAGQIAAYNPDELRKAGFNEDQIKSLMATGGAANAAQQELNATPKPTNAQLGVLQQALKAKSGVGNQAIGTSQLFDKAGISTKGAGGYAALAQSLSQRRAEMGQTYDSYANLVQQVGGQMTDVYNAALDNYKATMSAYESQVERIDKINAEAREYERALDLMKRQNDLARDTKVWEAELEAKYAKPEFDIVTDSDGVPTGYYDKSTGEYTPYDAKSTAIVGDQAVNKNWLAGILGGDKEYQCGTGASTISTAPKVGNMWSEKRKKIETKVPSVGDKLLIPLGVKSGSNPYGHVATVLYKNGSKVYVWEWNKNMDEKGGFGVYDLNDLQAKYGDDWGFAKGELKPQIQTKLEKGDGVLGTMIKMAQTGAAIGQNFGDTKQGFIGANAPNMGGGKAGAVIGGVAGAMVGLGLGLGLDNWQKKSFEDKYYALTGDENIRNPKSDIAKDYKNFTPEQKDAKITALLREQQAKAAQESEEALLASTAALYKQLKITKGKDFNEAKAIEEIKNKYGQEFLNKLTPKL